MLRTRRRDTNVKPNRRLDRKSSRGMLYENEELRLKTININAEIERGQSDIKKLKRENDMLKKEIWCLRDEYDKLDRLLKEKKIDFSSSSTTCSESDSCSSCSDDSDEVETSQNLENVQKTKMDNINREFDHLSVVPEENSTENSEKTNSIQNEQWNCEKDVIKPDQSYPNYQENKPVNFFSPIKINKTFEQTNNDTLYPGDCYASSYQHNIEGQKYYTENSFNTNATNFYQNMLLMPNCNNSMPEAKNLEKSSTDLLVKIDNCNFENKNSIFSNTPSQSTFSNGGNLEELLNDIETISQRSNFNEDEHIKPDVMTQIQREDFTYLQNPVMEHLMAENGLKLNERPYKSELNVVLMPNPMPLIGFDKYRNIQRSFESINSKILDEMSASQQNLCVIPPQQQEPNVEQTPLITISPSEPTIGERNPFLFGNLNDNYMNSDYFNVRYNPDNFSTIQEEEKEESPPDQTEIKSASKSNLLDVQTTSENEENLKFKTTEKPTTDEVSIEKNTNKTEKPPSKLNIKRKVSIHFKGKKDKNKKLSLDSSELFKPKTVNDKKHSLFDIKFNDSSKQTKINHQKTPSCESKKSTTETSNVDGKTGSSSDSKTSNCDKKNSITVERKDNEKKVRKSVSVSPDRSKHVHVKEDGGQKRHKKHKNRDRNKNRRSTIHTFDGRNMRERSYSVCTDRSNMLESRLGFGYGSPYLYEDYSDRDSMTSCDTVNTQNRKMSTISNVQLSGKLPWCGCWGNGCL